jgi:glucose/mannose-6-phosphate isomerase
MTLDECRAVDPGGMYDLLCDFPDQITEAVGIGRSATLNVPTRRISRILLCGMGGSAIGGDLLRSTCADELGVPFLVNRSYRIPAWVGPETLVIASSYSGNTEETLEATRRAARRGARMLAITSGGAMARLARQRRAPVVAIPGGLPPRAALAYSFFPLLIALIRLGFLRDRPRQIQETVTLLRELGVAYAHPERDDNPALEIARGLAGRIGIIYSGTEHLDAVNTRWRGQMAENAKTLVFGNVLPEMNHNEIVGWNVLGGAMREMQVILLRDREDHRRVSRRMDLTREMLTVHTGRITELWSRGSSRLARIFSLVHLGDWASYYLAVLHGRDPMPVQAIDHLKRELDAT